MSNKDKSYNNFTLLKKEFVKEENAVVLLFEHNITKTQVIKVLNDDDEKCFTICFKTLPDDNSGTPHILEHSVLCGSKRYPLKDPYAVINQSLLSTYNNASTYPDKTTYQFASTHFEEFLKIMDIYLDAVFNPLVLEDKKIFLQEGWRFDIKKKEDKLKYNGVVYGEMLGSTSTALDIFEDNLLPCLYPDTVYRNSSGGMPKYIPELSYDKFLNFYNKYYHPTNSKIYIHGNGDIKEELKVIDSYLSNYQKSSKIIEVKKQIKFEEEKELEVEYGIDIKEDIEDKYCISYNLCLDADNKLDQLGIVVLYDVLLGRSSSILKKAIIDKKIAKDVIIYYEDSLLQPFLSIVLVDAKIESKEKLKEIFYQELDVIIKNKLNEKSILASINSIEFYSKEGIDYSDGRPKGVYNCKNVLKYWLHDKDPFEAMRYEDDFKKLRNYIGSNYFEDLLNKYFVENKHKLLLIVKPNPNINYQKETEKKLDKIKLDMSEKELSNVIQETKKLEEWQELPDSIQAKSTIKPLNIQDLDKKQKDYNLEDKSINGIRTYQYRGDNNGITYLNFLFKSDIIKQEDIKYLGLLKHVLKDIKTRKYDFTEFADLVDLYTGGLSFGNLILKNKNDEMICKFIVSVKCLDENLDETLGILNNVFNDVLFDENKILDILKMLKVRLKDQIISSGHAFGFRRSCSYFNQTSKYREIIQGIDFYESVNVWLEDYQNNSEKIISKLEEIYYKIFNKQSLIINVNSNIDDLEFISKINLKNQEYDSYKYNFELEKLNEGIVVNSEACYVSQSFDFEQLGYDYKGEFKVFEKIMNYVYLWDNIRLKNGAYGSRSVVSREGLFGFYSYRDPKLKETLEVYSSIDKYLESFDISQEELNKYIIGSIAKLDSPMDIDDIGMQQVCRKIINIKIDDIQKLRDEVLITDIEKLKNIKHIVSKVINQNNICVVGNKNMINKNKNLFDNIRVIE